MQNESRFVKALQLLVGAVIAALVVATVTACAPTEKIDLTQVAAVIDVRTPAEFATGHLEGAVNYDIQSPDFVNQIASLDKSANYFIYCRSGNRAGAAIEYLTNAGFTGTLTNGGSVANAASLTELKVVN